MSSAQQQPQVRVQRAPARRGYGSLIVLAVVVVLLLIFVFQNTEKVAFKFLFFSFTWPAWLILLVTLVLGFLVGLVTSALLQRRKRRELRRRAQAA